MPENIYSFRLKKENKLSKILDDQGKNKGAFIRTALEFYVNHNKNLEKILEQLAEINDILKSGGMIKDEFVPKDNQKNDPLLESIQSLLDL